MRFYFIFITLIFFLSCKTVSYFNTPNDMLDTNCSLYMQNGTKQNGKITILFETGHETNDFIEFTKNNIRERILIDSIKFYEIDGKFYYPKIFDVDLNGVEKLLFVRRLTNEKSRMQFYELYQKKKQPSDANDLYYYFISLPHQDIKRPLNIASKQFVPNFNEKMSKVIIECPELSNKIQHKNKGYFFPLYSLGSNKKVEVFLRIINEYDSCN